MSDKMQAPVGENNNRREDQKTMVDYDAEARAVRANMEKLRALRLAKEAAEAARGSGQGGEKNPPRKKPVRNPPRRRRQSSRTGWPSSKRAGSGRERNLVANVVPAQAGTHNHRAFC